MSKNDGGPASEMSLRDYAMIHMMAAWRASEGEDVPLESRWSGDELARLATADVDAFLKQRDEPAD